MKDDEHIQIPLPGVEQVSGFYARTEGSDAGTINDVLRDGDHIPPFAIDPKVIVDLGHV